MLRSLPALALFIGISFELLAQTVALKPQVDRRIELMSIVFRLAGNDEYNGHQFATYVQDIHQHFDAYKTHPAVLMAKQVAQDNGVGFDAVMSMAIHLTQPPSLKPIATFTKTHLDKRWGTTNAEKFATLLEQFYRDAHCQQFFNQHEAVYQRAVNRFSQVLNKVDAGWYKQYYGIRPTGRFNVVIGVGNGGGNYGPNATLPNGKEEIYAIMGTWAVDSTKNPVYDEEAVLPIIVHEFNHSFVNSLIDQHADKLEAAGKTIYPPVADKMRPQAYSNWKTMFSESLVRASVVRYLVKHNSDNSASRRQIREEEARGFIWTQGLVDLLNDYESNRGQYPTLSSFMPPIVRFFGQIATDFPAFQQAYNQKRAHVVGIEPLTGKTQAIDPRLTELVIRFDKPMNPKKVSINIGSTGKDHFPLQGIIGFSDDNQTLTLKIGLKPNWDYSFWLTDKSFQTPDGYPLVEHEVAFKTGN